ncbi:flagellar export chaperone FliS [Brevibacillus invocatus]|uniref:flagellar export chaperone FliS n=1 Tax=Brevibacillus invocatus TaxID=173959 RepID=UPI00203B07A8|nr:flagellar export chaperone FliS [Brevibacillus invocatus]MCM3079657.1 flagellar export chaperone FliS [Brevibacillus invocatus]MCM3431133.1 flagellar export chaperone FliS [Brevibacillus invocatus]
MQNNPYQTYQNQSIQTATADRLLIMLFEGALRFLKESMEAIDKRDYTTANNKNIRVQNIVNELIITLNHEVGGDISKNLLAIYQYVLERLIEANIKKDRAILEEVYVHLKELHEAFKEAAQIVRSEKGRSGTLA